MRPLSPERAATARRRLAPAAGTLGLGAWLFAAAAGAAEPPLAAADGPWEQPPEPGAAPDGRCYDLDPEGWTREIPCPPEAAAGASPGSTPLELATEPAAPSSSDEGEEDEEISDWPCMVISEPGCGAQPHLEMGMGWGESHSYVGWQWSYRAFLEAGVLLGLHRDLQIGPVLGLGLDAGRVNSGYSFVPKMKARYWIGGWFIALDAALGAAFEHYTFDHGTENGTRVGPSAELGFNLLGVLGPYASLWQLADPSGIGGTETRLLIGFRGNLIAWFAGLAAGLANAGSIIIIP